MRGFIALLVLLLSPGLALAADSVSLASEVFVEKAVTAPDGRTRIMLDQPKLVMPGDNLFFVLKYRNDGTAPAANFSVTNPMPSAVAFREAPGNQAQYSVDGGHVWGLLSNLKVRDSDGRWRSAHPEDVTHVRWTFRQPLPVGASGKLTFRGAVR
jgi:uncharacterized repeat protein (TIGR01451 family)